jgi:hypothetical protein
MKISTIPSIHTLNKDSKFFFINNGIAVAPRAGIGISKDCPSRYLLVLQTCIENGWIEPVAHVTADEYMIMQLSH